MNLTVTNEMHTLRAELDKVKREKQAASGMVSSLKRDLSSKVKFLSLKKQNFDLNIFLFKRNQILLN